MTKAIKRPVFYIIGLASTLGVFLLSTDPYTLPLIFLIVPFLLLAALIYLVFRTLLGRLMSSKRKVRSIAGVTTGLLMLVILLQTIRQLSIRDFLIVGALFVGLTFYIRRIDL